MSIGQWKSIFEEMGTITGMASSQLDDDGNCTIVSSHPLCSPVNIYYDSQTDSVVIFSEIGFISQEKENDIMRHVLCKNYFNKYDINFAIGPTGALIGQLFLNVIDLTPQVLASCLNRFIIELMKTRRMLFVTKEESKEKPVDLPENALMI